MSKSIAVCFTLAALLFAAALVSPGQARAENVKGHNVKAAVYGNNGVVLGVFAQEKDGNWVEHNKDGHFTFKEESRYEWSVFLKKSDGTTIQIDLFTKEVAFFDGNTGKKTKILYAVMSAF